MPCSALGFAVCFVKDVRVCSLSTRTGLFTQLFWNQVPGNHNNEDGPLRLNSIVIVVYVDPVGKTELPRLPRESWIVRAFEIVVGVAGGDPKPGLTP